MRVIQKPQLKMVKAQAFGDDNYSVTLEPAIHMKPSVEGGKFVDVTSVGRVNIPFRINLDAREWGIKGISISVPTTNLSFEMAVVETAPVKANPTEYSRTVQFDPSMIEIQLSAGSRVTLSELALSLNEDFTVNYQESYFEGSTLMEG